jgi:hypothetical protein
VPSWLRIALGALLVAAVAAAGILVNFTLLGLTQDTNEPVGKLSPRAVFMQDRGTPTTPAPPTDGGERSSDDNDGGKRPHDGDD